jgi:large subunit ribosomal protein L17
MRHLRAGRKLGRNATHRLALYRNLALALFRHERIITTVEKAKAVRPFVEKLITLARDGSLHARRLAISRLGPMSGAEVKPASEDTGKEKFTADERTIVQKLFEDLGPRFKDRPGGYTRIIKRHQRRLGDGGHTAILELLRQGEEKIRARAPAAPRIEEQPAPETEPTAPPPGAAAGTPPAPETPPAATSEPAPPAAGGETPPPAPPA